MVVETIDFFDEEEVELPPPMSLRELIALNKAVALEDEDGAAAANGKPTDMQVLRAVPVYIQLSVGLRRPWGAIWRGHRL